MSSPRSIYLDHNATAPMLPAVIECVTERFREGLANPASQHAAGRHARQRLTEAKESIGEIIGARMQGQDRDQILITSGGTESNNLALRGMAGSPPGEVLISAVEHPSVLGAGQWLSQHGYRVRTIPVDAQGVVQPAVLETQISDETRLVSVMLGNNETGVLQPVGELAEVCHRHRILLHTDAVQAIGKIDVNFQDLQADAMSLTAHKFHGPRGIGCLVVRRSVPLRPLLVGGAQQLGMRPGTECVALVCGMARALEIFAEEQSHDAGGRTARLARLRDLFEQLIQRSVAAAIVHGQSAPRLPHTSNISFTNWNRQALLIALDRVGVACSTGAACSSGSSEPSHVLLAMGCPTAEVEGALRFSLGSTSHEALVRQAAERIVGVVLGQKTA